MCTYITKFFIEIPPCAKKVIFSTEFVLLDLNPHFYEVNQEVWKRPCAWRNFKNIFCVLSGYPKKPFRTEKPSIFNFRYVKEVWVSGLLGVKLEKLKFGIWKIVLNKILVMKINKQNKKKYWSHKTCFSQFWKTIKSWNWKNWQCLFVSIQGSLLENWQRVLMLWRLVLTWILLQRNKWIKGI